MVRKDKQLGTTQYWLSYGGGVNSTALTVLLLRGKLPAYNNFRIIFADTGDEREHTYEYIKDYFVPYIEAYGKKLEIVRDTETVYERWKRLHMVGSRIMRICTRYSKINPIYQHVKANGGGVQMIGIDAGEDHRAKNPKMLYPLVELGIDREGCEKIIIEAGLPVPKKSGCWHCPFLRVDEIIELARKNPCAIDKIEVLEQLAYEKTGKRYFQWKQQPVSYWRWRALHQPSLLSDDYDIAMPCECYD